MKRSRLAPLCLAALALAACDDDGPSVPPTALCGDGPTRLAVGQGAWLASGTGAAAGCLLEGGSEYALAYVDLRAVRMAESTAEPYGEGFTDYSVTVATGGASARGARAVRPRLNAAAGPGHVHDEVLHDASAAPAAALADSDPWERATPWTVGERFPLFDPYEGVDRTARVLKIYGGHFVLAHYEGDSPELVDAYVAAIEASMPRVLETALPLLRRTYVDRLPVTSTGSGQYLLLLREGGILSASAWASTAVVNDSVRNWLTFRLLPVSPNPFRMASLLTHETTHSFQRMYMHDTRPPGAPLSAAGVARWGVEGGANLVSWDVLRRLANVDLQANYDWRGGGTSPAAQAYAERAQPGRAFFNDAYDNSMGFMRDLMVRRVRGGESGDDALRQVSRGVIEGWYGIDRNDVRREGLAARMRARLGEGWSPDEALLTWALSHAADDQTPSPVFQDRVSRQVYAVDGGAYGWAADAEVSGAEAVTATRPYGAPGYMYLRDPDGSLRIDATADMAPVKWMVVRIR